jgi:hypothetical protein
LNAPIFYWNIHWNIHWTGKTGINALGSDQVKALETMVREIGKDRIFQ